MPEISPAIFIPSLELTYPIKNHFWVDDFPFPKVGHVSSLEGSWYSLLNLLTIYLILEATFLTFKSFSLLKNRQQAFEQAKPLPWRLMSSSKRFTTHHFCRKNAGASTASFVGSSLRQNLGPQTPNIKRHDLKFNSGGFVKGIALLLIGGMELKCSVYKHVAEFLGSQNDWDRFVLKTYDDLHSERQVSYVHIISFFEL